jgi:hypothetical protein
MNILYSIFKISVDLLLPLIERPVLNTNLVTDFNSVLGGEQSSKLGGSPKPVACKIVHGRIK